MVHVFLANGFEEVEALTAVDVLRRAGIEVTTVSVAEGRQVTGAHRIAVQADALFDEVDFSDSALCVLPGGMPGAQHLNDHAGLARVLKQQAAAGRPIAAICAAPMVLGSLGLVKGKRATCYPGFESKLDGATCTGKMVEQDGSIITGRGPAAAMAFALTLVRELAGEAKEQEVKQGMLLA